MTPAESLQGALAAEHAAVYVLGVVGGRVSATEQTELRERVRAAYELHRRRRDQLVAMVRNAGEQPVAAEVSYQLDGPARTAAQLRRAALEVEVRCAAVYADLVAGTSGAARQWALDALEDAAVRQLTLGGADEPFPGLGEL